MLYDVNFSLLSRLRSILCEIAACTIFTGNLEVFAFHLQFSGECRYETGHRNFQHENCFAGV